MVLAEQSSNVSRTNNSTNGLSTNALPQKRVKSYKMRSKLHNIHNSSGSSRVAYFGESQDGMVNIHNN
jgi:hypothetical protein